MVATSDGLIALVVAIPVAVVAATVTITTRSRRSAGRGRADDQDRLDGGAPQSAKAQPTKPQPPESPTTTTQAPSTSKDEGRDDEEERRGEVDRAGGMGVADVEVEPEAEPASYKGRLGKARGLLAGYLGSVRSKGKIDATTWDDLEEGLIRADVGVQATDALLDDLRARVKAGEIGGPDQLVDALKADLVAMLSAGDASLPWPNGEVADRGEAVDVWLFVGVNGVGKTTTVGKVATRMTAGGAKVLLAAGDTFRAAAGEQLATWAERSGADIVQGSEGGDPSSVVFDAVQRAAAKGFDLVLADTAGRLHNKVNLIEELKKIRRVADKDPGNVTEVLLVLDATTGQNGLAQAKVFTEAVEVSGVVLTKLDGTAKGGIVVAIQRELGLPVKLVGLGEGAGDLIDFDAAAFVDALF